MLRVFETKGIPLEEVYTMFNQVENTAKKSGLEVNYNKAKLSGTFDAHRVFQYAKEQGKGNEFFNRLYAAHFTEGELLSDVDTLVRLAKEVNLDGNQVQTVVENEMNTDQVQQDVSESQAIGVQGVPFFVINNKYSLSGAQSAEAFKQAL